jgi:hypothetical protein
VYGPGRPYFAPPPPKPPLSPLAIAAIVAGGLLVLGVGGTVLLGALVLMGASAEADAPPSASSASAAPAVSVAPAVPTADEEDEPPSAIAEPPPTATPTGTGKSGGASWFCTASASVRVCGFAGACNYQMVFGNGFGKDQFLAKQQAKNACEASARAKGASAVCVVSCSLR